MKILIIEKDIKLIQELISYIKSLYLDANIEYIQHIHAIASFSVEDFDVLIIDILLCENSEWEYLQGLTSNNIQIIYLTQCEDSKTINKVMKTEPLAYLTKPFNKTELHAFLRLVYFKISHNKKFILDHNYHFDIHKKKLYKNNKSIKLSKKEQNLIMLLIENENHIVSFEEVESLWEYPPKPSTLRTMIYRLREKLEHKFIITVQNEGLQIKKENK